MFVEELLDFWRLMIRSVINEKNNTFDVMSRRVRDKIAQVLAKLYVSSSSKQVPNDTFVWPEDGDKAIYSCVVAERWNVDDASFFCPTGFCFAEKFNPFFILKCEEDSFFKSAGAMRL